jgi:hypothetical protein
MCQALDDPCLYDGDALTTTCRPDFVPPGLRKDVMDCWVIDFKDYVEGTDAGPPDATTTKKASTFEAITQAP